MSGPVLYMVIAIGKGGFYGNKILYKNLKFFDNLLAVEDFVTLFMGKKSS